MAFIWGSNRADTLTGRNSADFIFGRSGDDTIDGRRGWDFIHGGHGDDTVRGGYGNDIIIGGKGTDTAEYRGNLSDYQITQNGDGSLTIQDLRPGDKLTTDGTDTVRKVESFQFADGTRSLDDILTPGADGFDFTVRVVDPNGMATAQHDAIIANMSAAVENWAKYISGDGSIDIDMSSWREMTRHRPQASPTPRSANSTAMSWSGTAFPMNS